MSGYNYCGATIVSAAETLAFGGFTAANCFSLGILGKIVYGDDIISYNLPRRVGQVALMVLRTLPVFCGYQEGVNFLSKHITTIDESIKQSPGGGDECLQAFDVLTTGCQVICCIAQLILQ